MSKITELPLHNAVDGTEEMVGVAGVGAAKQPVRMPAAIFAEAGTRPSPAELAAAVMATIVEGPNIELVDNGDGTVSIALKAAPALEGNPTAPTPAANDNDTSIATTAFVKLSIDALATAIDALLDDKQGTLIEGSNVDIVDNGDGTFTISSTATGSATIADGDYGDVAVATVGGVTTFTVQSGTNVAITVPDQVYGAAWDGNNSPPTKNAVYDKIETLVTAIAGKVASSAVGAANGVCPLDAGGQVPAGNLPSYIDDVLEFANLAAFPGAGETGKIYVAIDTLKQYRWSGSAYTELTASPGTTDNVPEGATNKYFTDARTRAAIATGLIDTAGTPAATDSVLTILGKVKKALFTDIATTIRGTAATGLAATAGTPVATDSILTVLGKLLKAAFTDLPASISAGRVLPNTDQAGAFNVGGTDTEKSYRYTGAGGHAATILDTLAVGAIVEAVVQSTIGSPTFASSANMTLDSSAGSR